MSHNFNDQINLLDFEKNFNCPVAGVDEVGRGPLAGPVVAAAVILDKNNLPEGIRDSKKISKNKREIIAEKIRLNSHYAYGEASVEEIDNLNILQASLLAMKRAIESLKIVPSMSLIDGIYTPKVDLKCKPIVKGDSKSISIAAASILAKVYRDKIMTNLADKYPEYSFEKNAGYGTKEHLLALKSHGITPIHRKSFKPIYNILN